MEVFICVSGGIVLVRAILFMVFRIGFVFFSRRLVIYSVSMGLF